MTSTTGSERGLTLVEVMVSVAILSVAAVLLMGAMGRAYSATAQIEARQEAYSFALSKMGEVELALRAGQGGAEHSGGSFQIEKRLFRWDLELLPVEEEPLEAEMEKKKRLPRKQASLTVQWEDGSYTQRHRVETLVILPKEDERGN